MNRINLLVVSYCTNHLSEPVKSRVVFNLDFLCLFCPLPVIHSQTDEEDDGEEEDWVDDAATPFGSVMISFYTRKQVLLRH